MLEIIFNKINLIKKKNYLLLFIVEIINILLLTYLIYRIVQHNTKLFIIIGVVLVFIVSQIFLFSIIMRNAKSVNQIMNEELLPYLLKQINPDLELTGNIYTREEAMKSLIISHEGTFKSLNEIKGEGNHISFQFSYVNNFISTGQYFNEVFSGTLVTFNLNNNYEGIVHLRDKGRMLRNKKLGLVCHEYPVEGNTDMKCYTNQDQLAENLITEDLINFYQEAKSMFKKGFYLSISENKLYIGIHNEKNIFQIGVFKKMEQKIYNKMLWEFTKIEQLIIKTTDFIDKKQY